MEIIVFTLNGCEHCESLKKRLTDMNVTYQEIEINENRLIWDQVVEQTGYNFLPTIFIKTLDNDTGQVFIPSVDFNDEDGIVEIIKNNI